ncbi:hypothetical protein EA462_11945 [Natrarchaeobius halalkaliphilus]|uniref:GtrA family protein n=1 Tax=Natrarchaeobius halalkaliphilus TaxID=1679091 RepID=A0A3N6LJY4_9EURY|nr:hypothetical protein [Natrarchaeobius halalkaliphilus]RQG89083.1 hypothetical protein EA462_11945 [Natrarchaeobius halalkaliphilus]
MDKERFPRWGWLLIGLFGATMVANLVNIAVLGPAGLSEEYFVVTIITGMSLVLIYTGVWYDDERAQYWEHSTERVFGDVVFVVIGAAVGSALAIVAISDIGLSRIVQDVIAMVAGFVLSWGLFWWRNPELYRAED